MHNYQQMGNRYDSFGDLSRTKKKIKFFFLALLIYAFLIFSTSFSDLYSQEYGGGYAESYLLINIGARATSMGGAYTAIAKRAISYIL